MEVSNLTSVAPSFLPSTLPLLDKGYSLEPDMAFGWVPKALKSNGPVPIKYWNRDLPNCSVASKTVYYGFCPKDSHSMHRQFKARDPDYDYSFDSPLTSAYDFISKKMNKVPDPRPFLGMSPDCPSDCLRFDSFFECGNLDRAVLVKADEYDLYVRPDSNTGGHFQWFYFKVSNVARHRTVRFNIVNLSRKRSLYESGKRPFCSGQMEQDWRPIGSNIVYGPSKLNRCLGESRSYYCLSFDIEFPDIDVYSLAELPPYSFTKQVSLIRELQGLSNESTTVRIDTLCTSLGGFDIPLVTITDERFPSESKLSLLIIGRVHPGEVIASVIIEGLMRYLCSSDPDAVILRQRLEVRIVPILNPDGVVIGNSRTSLSGNDLNRRYIKPDPQAHVEVWSVKELLGSLRTKLFSFIDVHGHSTKKGSFLLGPPFPLHNDLYYMSRVVPKLMSEQTEMFRYFSCNFRVSKSKRKAARAVVASEFGIPYSYTFETSFHFYFNKQRQTVMLMPVDYLLLGELLIKTLSEFDILLEIDQLRQDDRSSLRNVKRGIRLERVERHMRLIGKRPILNETRAKFRSIVDIIRQIREEEPAFEAESSGSDTDSSEEDEEVYDREFIKQAISEVTQAVEGKSKHKTPKIRVVQALGSSRPELKSVEVHLPTLQHSPITPHTPKVLNKSSDQIQEIRRSSSKQSIQMSPSQVIMHRRMPSRQLAAAQTLTYPIFQRPDPTSPSSKLNRKVNERQRKTMHKLKLILSKFEPRSGLNASFAERSPIGISPTNMSLTLKLPTKKLSQSHTRTQKVLRREKNISIYSKFGPFPALPLMFD